MDEAQKKALTSVIDGLRTHGNAIRLLLDMGYIATEEQCEDLTSVTDWLHTMAESAWNKRLAESDFANSDPHIDHEYCTVCRECITCNLRPCRDGGAHTSLEKV